MRNIVPQYKGPRKLCPTCDRNLPATSDYFTRHAKTFDGWFYQCKVCKKKHRRMPPRQLPLFVLTKVCPTCNPPTEKPIDCFSKHKGFPDGHINRCKDCLNAEKRQQYHANPEKERQRRRAKDRNKTRTSGRNHYARNRECRIAEMREQYASDPEVREKKRLWGIGYRAANPEKVKARGHRHYIANKSHFKEKDMRRKAHKRQVTVEKVDYDAILAQYGRHCHICDQDILPHQKLEFDHVIPLDRGGPHVQWNIKPSHRICNRRKWNKLMEELTEWDRSGP